MKLDDVLAWLDGALKPGAFDDVSNNGLQIAREGDEVAKVAFAVDGSLASVRLAAAAGAQLLVVHHGISWGGGIRRLTGGVFGVVRAAVTANLALYAAHLPLDANAAYGNNWELARHFGLTGVRPAFAYHGNVIGVIGRGSCADVKRGLAAFAPTRESAALRGPDDRLLTVGVCSGGAGEFAEEARRLGCELYLTGEANWGDVIAAENAGAEMLTLGHYETETFGVRALARAMKRELGVETELVGK